MDVPASALQSNQAKSINDALNFHLSLMNSSINTSHIVPKLAPKLQKRNIQVRESIISESF